MKNIVEALAKATTEDEERNALLDAMAEIWPGPRVNTPEADLRWKADCILRGPRPGWIGVPLLAMPGLWTLSAEDGPAHARILPANKSGDFTGAQYVTATAERPSCALMLAILAATHKGNGE